MADSKKILTSCTRDCPGACGLMATVRDGRLTGLAGDPNHPVTRGTACIKARRYIERVYSPERVTTPLIRENGKFRRAGWDEALDLVADRLKAVCKESEPEAILYYQGYGERTALKLCNKYFFNLLGGATGLRGSLCGGTAQAAQELDLGKRVSHDPLDHLNSASMVLWGRNPVSTNISLVPTIREIKKRGGPVILIDPARTRSAALAERHIAPRPGGDGCLALAAAKLILEAGAEDKKFLADHAEGFSQFKNIADRYTIEDLCELAGVRPDDANFLARVLMRAKPTSILLGWGLHRHVEAHQMVRPIDALAAISGNLGVAGGGVSQGFDEYAPYDPRWWGDHLNPPRRSLLMPEVGREILEARDPEIRLIFVTASNPVCMAPNSARVAEAFEKTEFVVYSGHFLDDTAETADVFLPATTFLEEDDLVAGYGHNYLGPVNRAIEPVGECMSEFNMFQELSRRFHFRGRYRRDIDSWLTDLCAPVLARGISLAELRKGPVRLDAPMVPYQGGIFPTPSGKFQFMDEFEAPQPDAADPEFPFRLLSVASHGQLCSERTMAGHKPLPAITIDAREAARRGLKQGDDVLVASPVGRIKATLNTREGLRPDVALGRRGGWAKAGHGLNRLTRDMASRIGQGAPFYETRVAISPWPEGELDGLNILVVVNSPIAPGGNFVKALRRLGAEINYANPPEGDPLPKITDGLDGLVVLGGHQHAYDDETSPHFQPLMQLMRDFDAAGKPVAGICLGAQLMARAHQGAAMPMGGLEFGFVQHQPTPEGLADPVIGAALPLPRLMEFHEDTFELPPTARLLVKGETCPNQCFRVGQASYAFQFHLEADSAIAGDWTQKFKSGEIKGREEHPDLYNDAFFATLAAELPLLTTESDTFCRKAAEAWLRLGIAL